MVSPAPTTRFSRCTCFCGARYVSVTKPVTHIHEHGGGPRRLVVVVADRPCGTCKRWTPYLVRALA